MKGQVILILLLVMAVGLSIGLSVIQRSLGDLSSAGKVEQSSRAFSAAEAGIERALQGTCTTGNCVAFSDNSAEASVSDTGLLPRIPSSGQQPALEYPPLSKEAAAQFWLSDYNSADNLITSPYTGSPANSIDIYWGSSADDKAAIEITAVYFDSSSTSYKNSKFFYDSNSSRATSNNFTPASCTNPQINTILGSSRTFYCSARLSIPANTIMIRTRLLYNNTTQPVAVAGAGTCGDACSLRPQARVLTSSGTAGSVSRTVQLFKLEKVVPPFLDFAIFSQGEISK